LKYVHINCRKARTEYNVLIKINSALSRNISQRGYSPQDLMNFIGDFLEKNNAYMILVLDELDSLDEKGAELLYLLVRINDDAIKSNIPRRLSIIGIIRDYTFLKKHIGDTYQYFLNHYIEFEEYTRKEIHDILEQRVIISLNENVISNENLHFIAEIVHEIGDIRCGLNILWSATKIAEIKGLDMVSLNCIKQAYQDLVPYSIKDRLKQMSEHKLLLLYTITVKCQENGNLLISLAEAVEDYKEYCRISGIIPRAYSQLWNYIKECKNDEILKVDIKSKGIKGRKALIKIPDIPIKNFVQNITNVLETKNQKINNKTKRSG